MGGEKQHPAIQVWSWAWQLQQGGGWRWSGRDAWGQRLEQGEDRKPCDYKSLFLQCLIILGASKASLSFCCYEIALISRHNMGNLTSSGGEDGDVLFLSLEIPFFARWSKVWTWQLKSLTLLLNCRFRGWRRCRSAGSVRQRCGGRYGSVCSIICFFPG